MTSVPTAFTTRTAAWEMADAGFVVVQADGMGTNFRSKAFHDVCCKNLADAGIPDRIAWIKAAAHPEMDLARVGVYGGSFGGNAAAEALLSHGDFYTAAVADCGVYDFRLADLEYWMGWPVGPEYLQQSCISRAAGMRGKLLLLGGEVDRIVDPSQTQRMVAALIAADKRFDVLVMPGRGHGDRDPQTERRRREFLLSALGN